MSRQAKVAEEYINFLSDHATPKALTLQEIKTAVASDSALQLAITPIKTGQWKAAIHQANAGDQETLESLRRISSELCINSEDTLVLRRSRLVIPTSLQDHVLAIAHEGHQGVVRTKQLLCEKVWFTWIDDKVEEIVA